VALIIQFHSKHRNQIASRAYEEINMLLLDSILSAIIFPKLRNKEDVSQPDLGTNDANSAILGTSSRNP